MELFSAEFFSALAAIIVIDLVLAGDNAIVIALAARNLPEKDKHRAIVFGTIGAIVIRSLMTLGVVWLLKIPGLMLVGGLLLFWIAVKLIAPGNEGDEHSPAATTFWGAMKTIVIADAVMGVDNVLAVAGAAHGSFLLVVLGLLISIPIVVWGSKIVLKLIERHPSVIYIGGGVLAFTAAKMVLNEPMIEPWADALAAWIHWTLIVVSVAAVMAVGAWLKGRKPASVAYTVADTHEGEAAAGRFSEGGRPSAAKVERIMLAVNGSAQAYEAAQHLARLPAGVSAREIHLVYASPRLPIHIGKFLSSSVRRQSAQDRTREIFDTVRRAFAASGDQIVEHQLHTVSPGKAIGRLASQLGCSRIVIGTRRESALIRLVSNSVTASLLEHATVPVEVISRGEAPGWMRFGIPAGLGAVLALLVAD